MISGILLAAGESSRMEGAFKPLLRWGKTTVIGACVDSLLRSRLGEIIVVLGHREAEIRSRLVGAAVEFAVNDDYSSGMLSSIKTGLAMVSSQSDAAMIALVDQPMIGPDLINLLIDAYYVSDKGIVVPLHEGRHGHPIIISGDYVDDIMQLDDNSPEGLRALIDARRNDLVEVPVESSSVLEDIDRPADYERLSKQVEPIYEYHKWHP
jgi:CTP:molybdopterin cytidylyltransferase MocA